MLTLEDVRTIFEIAIIIIAGIWGLYKISEYREFKQWIQFEIEANIYKLKTPIKKMDPFILGKDGEKYLFSWKKIPGNDEKRLTDFLVKEFGTKWVEAGIFDKNDDGKTIRVLNGTNCLLLTINDEKTNVNLEIDGGRTDKFIVKTENGALNIYREPQEHTHAVEVVLKFTNKGKKRLRIYNIRTKISTLPTENVRLAENKDEDGHLRLITIFNSGNIVPEDIKFYYIEPQVEQVITFLTLITEPRELLRVNGKFSLEQDRIFPKKEVLLKYPSPLKQIYKLFPCLEKYVSSKKNSFLCKQIFKRFPRLKKYVTRKPRLLPHTAERTYQLDSEGYVKI